MTVTEAFKWQDAAACRSAPLDLFFGPEGEQQHEKPAREAEAKKICARCPVRAACLDDAVTNGIRFGVFGGAGEDERQAMRRTYLRQSGAAKAGAAA
jgi:WhiB family transcriptional regulator, redox-sensing transcriptional regulator